MSGNQFIDYYGILQVNPNCDARTLESAYRYLAKMYHPDRTETADTTKFNEVIAAYRVLRNPNQRSKYDLLHAQNNGKDWSDPPLGNGGDIDEKPALNDAGAHAKILM